MARHEHAWSPTRDRHTPADRATSELPLFNEIFAASESLLLEPSARSTLVQSLTRDRESSGRLGLAQPPAASSQLTPQVRSSATVEQGTQWHTARAGAGSTATIPGRSVSDSEGASPRKLMSGWWSVGLVALLVAATAGGGSLPETSGARSARPRCSRLGRTLHRPRVVVGCLDGSGVVGGSDGGGIGGGGCGALAKPEVQP